MPTSGSLRSRPLPGYGHVLRHFLVEFRSLLTPDSGPGTLFLKYPSLVFSTLTALFPHFLQALAHLRRCFLDHSRLFGFLGAGLGFADLGGLVLGPPPKKEQTAKKKGPRTAFNVHPFRMTEPNETVETGETSKTLFFTGS